MSEHHRLPQNSAHPIDAPASTEIRSPVISNTHNTRARKDDLH